jgi:hypothetical protein
MNKCLNCNKDVKNKYCNVSCQNSHQNLDRSKRLLVKKYGELKIYSVCCKKCNKIFTVEEREKLHPIKDKYFCSRQCANSRIRTDEIKNKVSISLKRFYPPFINRCSKCNVLIEYLRHRGALRAKNESHICRTCKVEMEKLNGHYSKMGRKSVEVQSETRRSKNEIHFANLCKEKFADVETNKSMFNGWDADVIIHDKKIAVLWNGIWHYKTIQKSLPVEKIQQRDSLKLVEITKCGYVPYVIKDTGAENIEFVKLEFDKFLLTLQ